MLEDKRTSQCQAKMQINKDTNETMLFVKQISTVAINIQRVLRFAQNLRNVRVLARTASGIKIRRINPTQATLMISVVNICFK